ncbi:MAG TPA: peroxiredoxin [Candidatus Thalassarchaeaceae archaeon]|jgi:peroxiredoxin|nr:peroxiredoxin [Euryarchaeota archaeon]DAC43789.1 MAG TPA: peroxiredoxin [Candidatus Poseidoniales archaeon]HII34918.1 peroxiredoxin [Candidatus Thalassarchaeaceae archaeon]|tara:strand:- start:34762 stop:35229 length:468 start_codon:yes stop_codon:yes gene_type:complete
MVKIGETAPAFTLKTTDKSDVSLSDFTGQNVILAFYPGAFTGVCDKEMCAFQDNIGKLNGAGAVVLGISVDSPWANNAFSQKYDLEFSLLSDVDRKVVKSYDASFVGLGGIEGYVSANRVVIVIDGDGIVRYRWDAENPGVEPDYDAVVDFASTL